MKTYRIEINKEQPLSKITAFLESIDFEKDQFQAENPNFVMVYPDGFYMAAREDKRLPTGVLVELKEYF